MQIRQKTHSEMIATLRKVGQPRCQYDLRDAHLQDADLRRANLWDANLQGADLRRANLRGANLWGADLRVTHLWVFRTTQYTAIYVPWQRILKIECLEYPIDHWLKNYEEIGRNQEFTEQEIKQYGMFIRICAEEEERND